MSIVNRDKGLDDFIVAAPRFITLSARDRKTSILRAPINTLLYKKAQICAHAYSIIKMGYVILFFIFQEDGGILLENYDIFFLNQKL